MKHRFVFQEEAPGDGENGAGSGGDDGSNSGSLLTGGDESLADGEFWASDGIKGIGDKPDWYNDTKFKSVSEQAKGHSELHKAFGSFTGTPKDGYNLPEGMTADDELVKAYVEYATESKMNQDGFDKGFELLSAQMGAVDQVNTEAEMAKLGDNAQHRIDTVAQALKNKFGDDFKEVQELVTTADGVILAEMIIKRYAQVKLPSEGGENPKGLTKESIIEAQNKKDEHGNFLRSTDPEYNKKILEMWKEWGGDGEDNIVVG